MSVIKCKMRGGDLLLTEGQSVAECEYCGNVQTVPLADNDKKLTLFARANRLRVACEFDKAAGVYESIVAEFPEESEAYWGLVLCKYGIEYVDDPATGKKIPTCHRSSFDSVMDDSDFEQAMENADVLARRICREEAKQIEQIRKGIIEVSANEEPYDIFICYKETDGNGDRTLDSVLAQDIYDAVTEAGYRTFFARITLEDKLGEEYEPYIFAALNSAKIMLSVGTDYEYYNAVWVKNEWSRFLKLMEKEKDKHLIPCFKGIDAYDMPKEFARLQAQDLGKVGAMQDLLRGIKKILPREQEALAMTVVKETVVTEVTGGGMQVAPLLKRAFMFLEDGDWKSADEYCEKVLDMDPECAEAYLGKMMADLEVNTREELRDEAEPFDDHALYAKIMRFADAKLKREMQSYIDGIHKDIREKTLKNNYDKAMTCMKAGDYEQAIAQFKALEDYKDSKAKIDECTAMIYSKAVALQNERKYAEAAIAFGHIKGYSDADARSKALWKQITERRDTIAFKYDTAIGLKTDGTVMIALGQEQRTSDWTNIAAIATGEDHMVGLKSDGTVVAVMNHMLKCDVADWTDIVAISAGDEHTVGLKTDGTVVAVGDNSDGECNVSGWTDIVAISAGDAHTVGLKSDGTVVAVGSNDDDQCDVSGWTDIVAIAAGNYHTVGLKSDSTVVAVGENENDQCDVSGWTDIVTIVAGDYHTLGLKSDGTVVAVGSNFCGQCNISGWKNIVAISAGNAHTVGLKSDGIVVAVGDNDDDQCDVSGWTDIVTISAGNHHTVGLKSDGTVVAVGFNFYGECDVSGWKNIVAICAGYRRTVGLKSDGTVVVVGSNDDDRCNVSGWTDIVTISAGSLHTVGLKTDGTVVAVGNNKYGQCNVSGWTDIAAISAGKNHTVGLKTDGTVVAVGYNGSGQCNVSGWTDIVTIVAGDYHTLGLKSDGTVVAVGSNGSGQCNVSGWTDIVAIFAGYERAVGLKSDGTVIVVGDTSKLNVSGWSDIRIPQIPVNQLEAMYQPAVAAMDGATTEDEYYSAAARFALVKGYRDADARAQECRAKADDIAESDCNDRIYAEAVVLMQRETLDSYNQAIKKLEMVANWKDAAQRMEDCRRGIAEEERRIEAHRQEIARQEEQARLRAQRNKRIMILASAAVCAIIVFFVLLFTVIIPNGNYSKAVKLMEAGKYSEAIVGFQALNGYKDSNQLLKKCQTEKGNAEKYNKAVTLMNTGRYDEAIEVFENLKKYRDSSNLIQQCIEKRDQKKYDAAVALKNSGKYAEATMAFAALGSYSDAKAQADQLWKKLRYVRASPQVIIIRWA